MNLGDALKALFSRSGYGAVSEYDRRRAAFMVRRSMAARFPVLAAALNHVAGDEASVVDFWREQLLRAGACKGRAPGWAFTRPVKVDTGKRWKPDPELARAWMEAFSVGPRELDDALRLDPEGLRRELDEIAKQSMRDG